ncbi:MAG TPA: glycerophosphodiester phosphodiesterase family protein [Candidatus Binatia bacterium]|nr:glycerophosphodiester phosphodiesterase family protein [Candidatus Binatia bacterium]
MSGAPRASGRAARPADFKRIAHRGASAECPENTLAAFRRAMELGAAMIECDLQLTADGHVVVFHDWTLERTTTGAGLVRERSLADVQALDAGSWRDPRFAGEAVPTLPQILDATDGRVELNLELKSERDDGRLVLTAMAEVTRHRALDRVLFSSFHMGLLARVRDASPHAAIAVLWSGPPFEDAFRSAEELAAVALHPRADCITPELVAEAHARGLAVNVWTVNSVVRMVDLVQMGVDGIISDHPGRLLEARARLLGA